MKYVTALSASAILGYGFDERSIEEGLKHRPVVIGCDSGSTDQGPCDLGSGNTHMSTEAYRRDLSLMIIAADKVKAPAVVSTAGGPGIDAHVDLLVEIALETGRKMGRKLQVAAIKTEVDRGWLRNKLAFGRVHPLGDDTPQLTEETIDGSVRIVAMMGVEPIQQAIRNGADVVIAGRSSDTALFAAVPLLHESGAGPSWHAGKILECGAAAAVPASAGDAMLAHIAQTEFIAEAPNPDRHCTPVSVAAHLLYENADPYLMREPSGTLDTRKCVYSDLGDGRVKVSGTAFHTEPYTVKLEGAEFAGYRSISIAGIRDVRLIDQLDEYVGNVYAVVREKIASVHPELSASDYELDARVYGRDAVMAERETVQVRNHEIGLLMSVLAPTESASASILGMLRAMMVHTPFRGQYGLCSNLAFPFSPSDINVGPVFRFNLRHVVALDHPLECFRTQWHRV